MPAYLPRGILGVDKMRRSLLNEDLPKTEGPGASYTGFRSGDGLLGCGLRQARHFEHQNNTVFAMVHDIISPAR